MCVCVCLCRAGRELATVRERERRGREGGGGEKSVGETGGEDTYTEAEMSARKKSTGVSLIAAIYRVAH